MKARALWRALLPGALFLVGGAPTGHATTLYVPGDYPTIQDGIDAAAFGDSVLVAPGTYLDYETRVLQGGGQWTSCAFLKDGVVVKSEGGPAVTTIDVSQMAGPQRIGIIARFLSSEFTVLEGFTVQGAGLGPLGAYIYSCTDMTIRGCFFRDFDGGPTTGGAIIINHNATIVDCEFANCKASSAGAIWHSSGHLNLIHSVFRDSGNVAVYLDQPGSIQESGYIENCQFLDNWNMGLAVGTAWGGATVRGCFFKGNVNYGTGPGALSLGQGPKTVENCVFIENHALGPNGAGGGLQGAGSPMVIKGNTFYKNTKTANGAPGGSISVYYSSVLENNIVVGSEGGAAIEALNGIETSCNVFWDNPDGAGIPFSSTDREVDPEFCDPDVYDLTLRAGSPCLPDDPLGCGLIGALGQGCGPISVEENSWGAIKERYR